MVSPTLTAYAELIRALNITAEAELRAEVKTRLGDLFEKSLAELVSLISNESAKVYLGNITDETALSNKHARGKVYPKKWWPRYKNKLEQDVRNLSMADVRLGEKAQAVLRKLEVIISLWGRWHEPKVPAYSSQHEKQLIDMFGQSPPRVKSRSPKRRANETAYHAVVWDRAVALIDKFESRGADLYVFWQSMRSVIYPNWRTKRKDAPIVLNELLGRVGPPVGLPLDKGESIARWGVTASTRLTGSEGLLWDLAVHIYPVHPERGGHAESTLIEPAAWERFHMARRSLAYFFRDLGDAIRRGGRDASELQARFIPAHCALIKLLAYLEAALSMVTMDESEGKVGLYWLCWECGA